MKGTDECKKILTKHGFNYPNSLTGSEVTMALLLRIIEQNEKLLKKSKV